MPLRLRWNGSTSLPVEGENLRPDALAGLAPHEVARRPIPVGNGLAEVGDLFHVEGDGGDGHLIVEGDLRSVRSLGAGLAAGRLTVRGDVGAYLGAGMSGGAIDAVGAVGDRAGAAMLGGRLHIKGDAGDHLGAALPGARLGMREGAILVEGSIGDGAGLSMRRGLIAVSGRSGEDLGRAMIAGSIFTFGPVARHPGAGMKRGTLALFGLDEAGRPPLLPTFRASGPYRSPFVTIYLKTLRVWGFPVPEAAFHGPLERFNGDLIEQGQGEILVS